MRKKHFLALAAALAVAMALLSAPMAAFATGPGDDYEDTVDDEQEAGEQTTIAAPGVDESPGSTGGSSGSSGSGSGSTGGSSGSSGGSSPQSSGGSSGTASSSDSSLASLGISPGTLSPAFSPNVYEYTATVDANVTQVSIPARPNSSTAVIASVSGAKSIRPGTNTVKIVVEAANGSTSTYTITVQCGSGTSSPSTTEPQDVSEPTSIEGEIVDGQSDGDLENPDGEDDEEDEDSKVSFDSNGYLIYEGNAYIPSEQMPAGDYVSLEKYNSLYEQAQSDRTKSNRMLIVFVVVLLLLLIVIVNLAFKLRDAHQDAKLGINGIDDDDLDRPTPPRERKVTKASKMREKAETVDASMIPDVKIPEQMKRDSVKSAERPYSEKSKAAARTKPAAKTPKQPMASTRTSERSAASTRTSERPATPTKTTDKKKSRSARADKDLEILDLNDL